MPNATLTDSNSIEYDASFPFPVTPVGSGPGGSTQVEIVDASGVPLTYNANGQATMANSSPVVIASDQTAVASNITQTGGNPLAADDAAAGTTVPLPLGGIVNTTYPTYSNLDRAQAQFGTGGELVSSPRAASAAFTDGFSNTASQMLGITTAAATASVSMRVMPFGFNGTTWDRMRLAGSQLGLLVEQGPFLRGRAVADSQIKGAAGFIHTVSIAPVTATPTAGLLTIYDSTAESGTVVYAEWIFATTPGHTVTLDIPCSTGIYVGFDGTLANVQVTVAYR